MWGRLLERYCLDRFLSSRRHELFQLEFRCLATDGASRSVDPVGSRSIGKGNGDSNEFNPEAVFCFRVELICPSRW